MPTVKDNIARWNAAASWAGGGEEWSGPWGGSEAQWWGSLLPRLHAFLPARTVLEIGPGHGRWTQYLKDLCEELIVVDVAERCIDICRERFAAHRHIAYHVGDGSSLPAVSDHSVDLAFSFDSLVHADADVLAGYVAELGRVLKPDGIGFIHHSNMGSLRSRARLARAVPERLRRPLTARGLLVNTYAWRAETTSAEAFADSCQRAGLSCIGQEMIAWEYGRFLTDVLSTCTPAGSRWERPNRVSRNPRFIEEARLIERWSRLYGQHSFPAAQPEPPAAPDYAADTSRSSST